tara:strand:- start:5473 stop:5694 length:222 start_codon:yes stop_codon:yes gene_type:complete
MHYRRNFGFILTSKWILMTITWLLALLVSLGLRFWGYEHPDNFLIRQYLVWILLFGPSLLLAIWLIFFGFKKQ